jgi:hypothetical protein
MDYVSVTDGFPLVEISHFSADDIKRAIKARTTYWTHELDGERELYGSMANLLNSYRLAGDGQLAPPFSPFLRDEWDGARQTVEYEYRVQPTRNR